MQVTSRHTSNDNWSESSWSETHTRPGQDHHHVLSEPSAGLTPSQPQRPLRPGPYGMGPVGSHCSSSGVSELAKTTVSTHITSFGPYTKPEWMQSKGMCRTKDPPSHAGQPRAAPVMVPPQEPKLGRRHPPLPSEESSSTSTPFLRSPPVRKALRHGLPPRGAEVALTCSDATAACRAGKDREGALQTRFPWPRVLGGHPRILASFLSKDQNLVRYCFLPPSPRHALQLPTWKLLVSSSRSALVGYS